MSPAYILPLNTQQATLASAGGKGLNLVRLNHAGLPVPGGFIITTAAYQAFVQAHGLTGWILEQVEVTSVQDPTALQAMSQTIRDRFAAAPMPVDVRQAIADGYAEHNMAAVAVRSSATAEDLPDMSFAGQQDTFLNVVGQDQLLRSVMDCWSSLWTARAIAYRNYNAVDHEQVALAVVVQTMIQSQASGVLFTANPLSGRRDEMVVDATLGLGEALVSGHVVPDSYTIDLAGSRIVSKRVGSKASAVHSQTGGGTVTVSTDASLEEAVPDQEILALARLGREVASLYDQPQDVEWAWAEGRFYILQARPITSLFPLPAGMPWEPLQVLFSLNHVQGMLEPFTPLGQDALILAFVAAARIFGRHLSPDTQREMVVAGERLYINVTPLTRYALGRRVATGVLGAIEPAARQAMEEVLEDPRLPAPQDRLSFQVLAKILRTVFPVARQGFRALLQPDAERKSLLQDLAILLQDLRTRSRKATTLAQRLDLWLSFYDLIPTILPRVFPLLAGGVTSFFQLRRLASIHLGTDRLALEVARGLPHNVTTQMDLALWTVAEVIGSDPDSTTRFSNQDPETLAAAYQAGSLPLVAQVALRAFLDRYGMRGLAEIDLGRPRWRENPGQVIQNVQSYLLFDDPLHAPDAVFHQGAKAAQSAVEQLAAAMPNPWQALLVRFLASRVRALAGLRELPKFVMIQLMDLIRQGLLASGRELANRGILDQPDDLFFLRFQELEALADGADQDWRALVARRRKTYRRARQRRQIPRLLLSNGQAYYEGLTTPSDRTARTISGSPVSPGVIEAIVRVVVDPRHAQLAPGEILVCPGTDPSWTPLFLTAAGLVMEVGGLMTHGSVVAREYGIPAVVGVHDATQRLRTGQRIRVDGYTGQILLLDPTENSEDYT